MATLTGKRVKDTYKDLLQVSNTNSGVDATMRAVEDGEGTATLLYLSSAGVAVNTGLTIGGTTATTSGVTLTGGMAATKTITSADADGTRHFSFTATSNTDPAASAEVNGGYFAFNKTAGSNGTYIYNALEGVYRSQYADESSTGRGVYGRFYIDPASSATLRTGIGVEASARASYAGGTEIAAESGTCFVGSRIWMAPYFTSGTVGNVNNFWGLWIYGEHTTQRNADAAIKIGDAGGGWAELINGTNTTGPGFTFGANLDNASGNEIAYTLNSTTNKVAGDDTLLLLSMTDTLSPGTSLLLDAKVGGTSKFSVDNTGAITSAGSIAATKTITTADADGTRHFSFTATSNTDPAASAEVNAGYFAFNKTAGSNGTYIYNALEGVYRSQYADESSTGRGVYGRFYIDPASSATLRTGIGVECSARASYAGGTAIAAESGTCFVGQRIWMAPYFSSGTVGNVNNFWGQWIYGEHTTQRNADAAIKIGDAGGGWAELINGTNTTGPGFTFGATLDSTSADETAYTLNYTTNKASGTNNDTGLLITMTDTASPGLSYPLAVKVGSSIVSAIDNSGYGYVGGLSMRGNFIQSGTAPATGSGPYLQFDGAGIYAVGSGAHVLNVRGMALAIKDDSSIAFTSSGGAIETQVISDTVTLTDNTLTALFDVALVDTAMAGGTFHYTIKCVDATPNYQVEHGTVNFMAFNKAAAYTTDFNVASSQILGSGTLATTFSITTGTNLITMNVTSNSSLTPTAFTLTYQLFLNHSGAVTKKT